MNSQSATIRARLVLLLCATAFLGLGLGLGLAGCKVGSSAGDDDDDDDSDGRRPDARIFDDGGIDRADADLDRPDADPSQPDAGGGQGCSGSGEARQPFGNHNHPYASGTIRPRRDQGEMDRDVTDFYEVWKDRHLVAGCGSGHYYVDFNGDDDTVSEAHGYGMVIAALLAGHDPEARTIFDGMYDYYDEHRSEIQTDLMAWKQASCGNTDGVNSATDGDLDIAYALLLADRQWGSDGAIDYHAEAVRMLGGILAGDVDDSGSYLLLGDWTGDEGRLHDATRPSDFMPGHLASFAAATDGAWGRLLDSQYQIFTEAQGRVAPSTGLFPDFLIDPLGNVDAPDGELLEDGGDDDYEYNACRVPLRLATHFVTTGDGRGRTLVTRMNGWIQDETGGDPSQINAGYHLDGSPLPNSGYTDMSFVAPFGVSAMVDASNQQWLDRLWDFIAGDGGGGYYGDTIKLMSMIVMSGNWWSPEAAPCD